MRLKFRFLLGLAILLTALLLGACGSSGDNGNTAAGMQVGIKDSLCPSVSVKVGDQVTWRNEGNVEHQVSAQNADGTMIFDSGALERGDTFSFTFSQAGTFNYSCISDGSLTGTVTVE